MTNQNIQQTSEVYLKIINQVRENILSDNIVCNINDLEAMVLGEYKHIIREGLKGLALISKCDSPVLFKDELLYKQVFHYIQDLLQYRSYDILHFDYEERGLTLVISAYDGKWHFELHDIKDDFDNPFENTAFETKEEVIHQFIENFILIKNSGISMQLF